MDRNATESRRRWRRCGLATVLVSSLLAIGVPASAADQTTWSRSSASTTNCGGLQYAGYVNFCRWLGGSLSYSNGTPTRDSDLRSYSGFYQDKYLDDYIVGNLSGSSANTYRVTNNLPTYTIRVWTGTCYSGTGTYLYTGDTLYPSSSNNLRSFARWDVTSC